MRRTRLYAHVGVAAMVLLTLLAAGCARAGEARTGTVSGTLPTSTSVPRPSTPATSQPPAKADRQHPLAQRVFRVTPAPKTEAQKAAVAALEGYLDELVTAFATNRVPETMLDYAARRIYENAQALIRKQVEGHFVLYGAFTFTIRVRELHAQVGVLDVCVNQRHVQRHDPKTDKPSRFRGHPYVLVRYTLNVLSPDPHWAVVGYGPPGGGASGGGKVVASCPS